MKKPFYNLLLGLVALSFAVSPNPAAATSTNENLALDSSDAFSVAQTVVPSDSIQDLNPSTREEIKLRPSFDIQFVGSILGDTRWRPAKVLFYKAFQPTAKAFLQNYFEMSEACAEVASHFALLALHRNTPIVLFKDSKPEDYAVADGLSFWDAVLYSLNNGHVINTCLRNVYQGALGLYASQSGFQEYADRVENNFLANATRENSLNGLIDVAYNGGNYLLKSITPQEYYQTWARLTDEPVANVLEAVVWWSSWANPFSWWDWANTVFSTNTTPIAPTNNREGFVWDVGVKAYDISASTLGWCFSWVSLKAWSHWLGELAGEFAMGYSSVQKKEDSSQNKK